MQKPLPSWNINVSTEEEEAWLDFQIDAFNRKQLAFYDRPVEIPKNYIVKDGNTMIAGVKACFYLEECLSIGVLFVDEKYRGKGIGSFLLHKVETEAKASGAKLAHLYTFDFHAKDFYLKHGYEVFGILENCPSGHSCYYLKKDL